MEQLKDGFMIKMILTLLLSILYIGQAHSVDLPAFTNLNQTQVNTIVEEFGASNVHTTVSGASTLGTIFGVEAGVVAGLVDSEGIEEVVQAVNPGANLEVSGIPHASLFAAVSLPLGFGAEATFLPDMDLGDIEMKRVGLAGKFNFGSMLGIPIVDLALKAHFTTSELSYDQAAAGSSPAANITFESESMGLDLMVGYDLNLVLVAAEVYASLGYVSIDGDLTSSVDIFDTSISGLTASSDESGLDYKVGANLKLLLFKFGIEYQSIIDNQRITAKISAKF